jgi:hypothetical protein
MPIHAPNMRIPKPTKKQMVVLRAQPFMLSWSAIERNSKTLATSPSKHQLTKTTSNKPYRHCG